jgi:tetratricopeptide (TPR) repeat protein
MTTEPDPSGQIDWPTDETVATDEADDDPTTEDGALPNLVVIGAMKCGTTSLHHYLDLHPEISMSAKKEINFFYRERTWARGLGWYSSNFDGAAPVRGESSPNYTKSPRVAAVAAARMQEAIPDARLVFVVRDPIERALSHYVHTAVKDEEHRPLSEALADVESPYVQRGLYFACLRPYLERFPREQVLVIEHDDLLNRRGATLARIFAFLGVDPSFTAPEFERQWLTAEAKLRAKGAEDPRARLDDDVRERLREFYASDAKELRKATGLALSGWDVARPRRDGEDARAVRREFVDWRRRLELRVESGEIEAAVADADEMVEQHPDDLRILQVASRTYELAGTPSALDGLRKLVALAPDDDKLRNRLVNALVREGEHEEAAAALGPLAARRPSPARLTKVGLLLQRAGRHEEAVARLREALGANPAYLPALEGLDESLEALGRHEEAAGVRDSIAAVAPKLSTAEVVTRIDSHHAGDAERFVVNIGCRDGKSWADPCYDLYVGGYPGIAVDAGDFPSLHRNLLQPEVRKLLNTTITPDNVVSVLRSEGCPRRFSLLKIDIDSFDGVVLEAALRELEPNVVQIEVNPEIPPPLRFAIQYDPRYRHSGWGGFFGCSVSFVADLGRRHGLELLEIDFSDPPMRQDVILVRREYLRLFGVSEPVDERDLYFREPPAIGSFRDIDVDTAAWRDEEDMDALLSTVWDACVRASEARSGAVLPFLLTR